jgi:peptide/nickel transport system substrate-binding protein
MDDNNSSRRSLGSRITKLRSILRKISGSFSPTEKLIFSVLGVIIVVISFTSFNRLYSSQLIEVPSKGGSYIEGIVGTPRFINPILATSDADRDLTTLIYSGLMKATPDGSFIPDLAESYSVSEDGLEYTFILREGTVFHDESTITSEDVIFTIEKIQDPFIKSTKRNAWEGVSVEATDERTVVFTLSQPYAPFIENTTIGILPKSIWKDISSDEFTFSIYNTEPVGSGPFVFDKLKTDSSRSPSEYILTSFNNYALGKPFLEKVSIKLYPSESDLVEAFENKKVDTIGGVNGLITREYANQNLDVYVADLPRVFGVFFNQSQNDVLLNPTVRKALDISVPREKLVQDVLEGYGIPIDTPFGTLEHNTEPLEERISTANEILEANGWIMNESTGVREKEIGSETLPLSFTLSTGDKKDLKFTAEAVREAWKKIGVDLLINIYESGDLNQNIIRPRKYEALLFGEIIGRELDLHPFWHSSERNDPGLNIALYTNITSDDILEQLRTALEPEKKDGLLKEFSAEINKDRPAIFLYSPQYTYITRSDLRDISLEKITLPSERFIDIHTWYIETNNVWNLFIKPIKN